MKIAITGATGLIGKALCLRLMKSGHRVIALVRDPAKVEFLPKDSVHTWKSDQEFSLEKGLDAFIHLAGEPVVGFRWSVEQKERILHSRIESTKNVIASIRALEPEDRPRVLILASAIGIYGDRGDEELTEERESGNGFLAEVTKQWEQAADEAIDLGIRIVFLRTARLQARSII